MRDTLVQAKVGVQEMREALARSTQRLEQERRELETMRRRKGLAAGIGDLETVRLAERHESIHAERVQVLEQKMEAQRNELALAERDVEEMTKELRVAVSGASPHGVSPEARTMDALDEELSRGTGGDDANVREEIDSLGRARARADREVDAQRKLDELKRRMGK